MRGVKEKLVIVSIWSRNSPVLCDLAEPFIYAFTEWSHVESGEQEGGLMSSIDYYQPQQCPGPWPLLKNYILSPYLKGNAFTCRVTPWNLPPFSV